MGKGGTKFVSDAVGVRTGRPKSQHTNKDLKKMMDKYLETGQHPDIQSLQQQREDHGPMYPLPDPDPHRQYVFLDLSVGRKNAGSIFHKLLPHYGIFGGRTRGTDLVRITNDQRLRHLELGAVSISRDGQEIGISLGRSLTMDATHQVVGRVNIGKEIVEALSELSINPDDSPAQAVRIVRTGPTTHTGAHEELGEAAAGGKAKTAAEKAEQDSSSARSAVLQALEVGMKRKAGETAAERSTKPKLLHAMLGDLSGSESGSESSEPDNK